MTDPTDQHPTQPSEEELRAAYEAELSRITSSDLLLQTVASLLNLGARRLGLTGNPDPTHPERDPEQVRDAIDGVRALMPILERRHAAEIGPLRDALSQLQMAYAREAPRVAGEQSTTGATAAATQSGEAASPGEPGTPPQPDPAAQPSAGQPRRPGPAESSGRLWVPGR